MNKYDKIWIPTGIAQGESIPVDAKAISGHYYKPATGLICLSVEELRDIWEAAEKRIISGPTSVNYKGEFLKHNHNFVEYFTSKGIKLD